MLRSGKTGKGRASCRERKVKVYRGKGDWVLSTGSTPGYEGNG